MENKETDLSTNTHQQIWEIHGINGFEKKDWCDILKLNTIKKSRWNKSDVKSSFNNVD